jgi:hypothetical protein
MLSRKLVLLLVLSLFPLLCGCDGGASYDTPGNPRPVDPPITGTWRIRSISTAQTGVVQCPATTFLFTCDANSRFRFTRGGTFVDNTNTTRLYTLAGVQLTYSGLPATTTINVTFGTDLMQWNAQQGAESVEILFDKI